MFKHGGDSAALLLLTWRCGKAEVNRLEYFRHFDVCSFSGKNKIGAARCHVLKFLDGGGRQEVFSEENQHQPFVGSLRQRSQNFEDALQAPFRRDAAQDAGQIQLAPVKTSADGLCHERLQQPGPAVPGGAGKIAKRAKSPR